MSNNSDHLITELRTELTRQQYSPTVVGNYCAYAREFLDYLLRQNIPVTDVSECRWRNTCVTLSRCSRNAMVDLQGHTGTPSLAPESMHCCGSHRVNGHPRR